MSSASTATTSTTTTTTATGTVTGTPPKKKEMTLDDVLFQRTKEPYSVRMLFNYLDTVAATELLDFWVAGLDVRNMFEPTHPRSSYSMHKWEVEQWAADGDSQAEPATEEDKARSETLKQDEAEVHAEHKMSKQEELNKRFAEAQRILCQTYISDDAPLCINISDTARRRVLDRVPEEGAAPVPGLFDECMTECEKLIRTNHWNAFKALADKAVATRPAVEAKPPPRPRQSQVIKGKIRTKEQIKAIVPKDAPPVTPGKAEPAVVVGAAAAAAPPPPPPPPPGPPPPE